MLDTVTRDDFAGCTNTVFKVFPDTADGVELVLAEVSELRAVHGQESFSLLFRGPAGKFLQQGIYPMEHEQLKRFELFIVPIARDEAGFSYEAVFNRLVER